LPDGQHLGYGYAKILGNFTDREFAAFQRADNALPGGFGGFGFVLIAL
jgi:hypothetical protein